MSTLSPIALADQELALLRLIWIVLALGSLAYFVHLAIRAKWLARVGFALTAIGAVLLTALIAKHWVAVGHAPYSNLYEYLIAFSWGICVIYLALEVVTKRTVFGALVVPLGFAFALFATRLPESYRVAVPLMPALKSTRLASHLPTAIIGYGACAVALGVALRYLYGRKWWQGACAVAVGAALALALRSTWLVVHVGTAIIGYGACAVGFGVGLLYLFRQALFARSQQAWVALGLLFLGFIFPWWALWGSDRVGQARDPLYQARFQFSAEHLAWGTLVLLAFFGVLMVLTRLGAKSIPEENTLDQIGYRAIAIAFPFLTLINITGMVWAREAWGRIWDWDPKETWSAITWFIYLVYLHARLVAGWRGLWAAWFVATGFVVVLFTFLGVNYLGGLHAYFAPQR